jgi:phosphoadenosine phosphosulfate reductase
MGIHRESSASNLESGYASGASSTASLPSIIFTKQHLKFLNSTLNNLSPIDILRWCKITLPNLYQTTAFGISGLVTLDMLSKIGTETPSLPPIDAIFLDTLYHFQETHELIEKTKARYPNVHLHIYKPEGVETTAQFEAKHGKELWKTDDNLYDWVAKVEPAQRAYSDLSVAAVLTGRRRSQGAKRDSLDIIEVDEAGLIKINPLASWSFKQVQEYIKENNVPYNALLDQGYKSVGDWHSTEPVKEGEDERAGRWKGQEKSECGIHNKRSKYALFLMEMEQKRQQEELAARLQSVDIGSEVNGVEVVPTEEKVELLRELNATVEHVANAYQPSSNYAIQI